MTTIVRRCWSRAGLPLVMPKVILGARAGGDARAPSEAEALVVTYLLNNDAWTRPRAAAWERKALQALREAAARPGALLKLSFSVEAALESELARESFADVETVLASYAVMLAYVAFALGRGGAGGGAPPRSVAARAALAAIGVGIVVASVLLAAAACGLAGVGATLIISEAHNPPRVLSALCSLPLNVGVFVSR